MASAGPGRDVFEDEEVRLVELHEVPDLPSRCRVLVAPDVLHAPIDEMTGALKNRETKTAGCGIDRKDAKETAGVRHASSCGDP